jgi:carbon storage regulator CsrA
MLVLSRKIDEEFTIEVEGSEPIKVRVVKIEKKSVRIGIEADKRVIVVRSELCPKIEPHNSITP